MTKILLTGSEGFVGRNLLDYFLSKNYTLIAPSYHELDLTNSEDVENYLASNKFDYIVLFSDGSAIRNFCYISDATIGFLTVLLKGKSGEAYNVATDHEISIKDLALLLTDKVFPEKCLTVLFNKPAQKDSLRTEFSKTTVNIEKCKSLGWRITTPIQEGFKRTVEHFQQIGIDNDAKA